MLIPKTAGCASIGDWAKKKGYWHPYTETPEVGDLVLFDFSGKHSSRDHIGVVTGVGTSTVTTIEGNTSAGNNANGGAVQTRQRSVAYVVGYIRVPYTKTQTAARLIAIALSQVGVTEWPADSNTVKYNTWYYGREVSGSAYPWCVVFLVWCFAVLCGDVEDESTKTGETKATICTVTAPVLVKGSTGGGVKTLQAALNARKYACGTADGIFGAKTLAAVKAFQKANGLTQDGQVGALTWGKLIN